MNEIDLDFAATAKPFASVVLCFTGVDHEERVCFDSDNKIANISRLRL